MAGHGEHLAMQLIDDSHAVLHFAILKQVLYDVVLKGVDAKHANLDDQCAAVAWKNAPQTGLA